MTLISRVRCDGCGQEDPWPPPALFGSGKTEWWEYLPNPDGPMHHACSIPCLLEALRLLGPVRDPQPGSWHPV